MWIDSKSNARLLLSNANVRARSKPVAMVMLLISMSISMSLTSCSKTNVNLTNQESALCMLHNVKSVRIGTIAKSKFYESQRNPFSYKTKQLLMDKIQTMTHAYAVDYCNSQPMLLDIGYHITQLPFSMDRNAIASRQKIILKVKYKLVNTQEEGQIQDKGKKSPPQYKYIPEASKYLTSGKFIITDSIEVAKSGYGYKLQITDLEEGLAERVASRIVSDLVRFCQEG